MQINRRTFSISLLIVLVIAIALFLYDSLTGFSKRDEKLKIVNAKNNLKELYLLEKKFFIKNNHFAKSLTELDAKIPLEENEFLGFIDDAPSHISAICPDCIFDNTKYKAIYYLKGSGKENDLAFVLNSETGEISRIK